MKKKNQLLTLCRHQLQLCGALFLFQRGLLFTWLLLKWDTPAFPGLLPGSWYRWENSSSIWTAAGLSLLFKASLSTSQHERKTCFTTKCSVSGSEEGKSQRNGLVVPSRECWMQPPHPWAHPGERCCLQTKAYIKLPRRINSSTALNDLFCFRKDDNIIQQCSPLSWSQGWAAGRNQTFTAPEGQRGLCGVRAANTAALHSPETRAGVYGRFVI